MTQKNARELFHSQNLHKKVYFDKRQVKQLPKKQNSLKVDVRNKYKEK